LKSKSASAWSAAKSEEHYGFKRWGAPHISVDDGGFVNVQPRADGRGIRVLDVVDEALGMGLKAPMVIRFQDLLRHRVIQLNECFNRAIKDEGYKGEYRGVFPIKVNQLREVVDEIVLTGKDFHYGLEAGSKPELMIALAMHEGASRLIICNGYKDDDYIRLALLGRKLGKKIVIVVEQLAEIDDNAGRVHVGCDNHGEGSKLEHLAVSFVGKTYRDTIVVGGKLKIVFLGAEPLLEHDL
jgi:arginine decarboxylase